MSDRNASMTPRLRVVEPAKPLAKRRRRWGLIAVAVAGIIVCGAAAVGSIPFIVMGQTRASAVACLERIEQPRGPRLTDCSGGIDAFSQLAEHSYVHHDSTYRAEELWARIMVAEYENASVGAPDPAVRKQTAKFVDDAQAVVEKGSQRISLDELGPAVATPNLGKLASSLGDRQTLLEHSDWWGLWPVRLHVLQAALIEGDVDQADQIARRYAEWDPRDADLRTYVGAVMCLGKDPGKGLELLARVPGDRAEKRYAAIGRNYGEVLAVMEACAKKAGVDAPTPPQVQQAGRADVEYTRMVQDIRLSKLAAVTHESVEKALGWLEDDRGLDDDELWARPMLLAAIVSKDERVGDAKGPLGVAVLANASKPRASEAELGPSLPLLPEDVLFESPGLEPMLPADALAKAAATLARIAESAKADQKAALDRAAAALETHAAVAFARAGDVSKAEEASDRATKLAGSSPAVADLTAASLLYVAGDAKRALVRAGAAMHDEKTGAAASFVAALCHMSLGENDHARELGKALVKLDLRKGDPRLVVDIRWLDVALAEPGAARPGAPLLPEWTGMADASLRWRTHGSGALEVDLEAWRAAIAAPDEQRLAFRYALMRHRGDAPSFLVPWLGAAARLAPAEARGPSVEVWLDAVSGEEAPRQPLSAYVFARVEAARARGDHASADAWQTKLVALRAVKSSEPDLEIARFLGI